MPRKPEPSFRLKQIIWDIAASDATDNLSAIYREVDYRLEKLREEDKLFEDVPEERKVRDIIRLDIQRLHPEVVVAKLPKHVWRLRNDYEAIEQLAEGLKTQQEAPTKTVIEQKQEPYEETPHKWEIRDLAEALKNEIKSIMTSDSFIPKLEPEQVPLFGEKLPITIRKDEIRVTLSNEGEGEVGVLPKALCAHLETSGFAKVLTDIASWSSGMADNLRKYHELFTTVRKKLERTYDTSIAVPDSIDSQGWPIFNQSGFTMYFPLLICASALEQTRGSSDYIDMEYWREDLNLKYGVYTIYIGTSDKHMQLFVDAHREWGARCAMWKQTKAIAKQRQDLDNIATDITQQLHTFIHMERLPGHCKLCS